MISRSLAGGAAYCSRAPKVVSAGPGPTIIFFIVLVVVLVVIFLVPIWFGLGPVVHSQTFAA